MHEGRNGNPTSYGCGRVKRAGTCDNQQRIKRSEIEARVLGGIKDKLMNGPPS